MAMKVPLSFKKKEKEMYEFITKQLSASIYIKQLIKNEMDRGGAGVSQSRKGSMLDI